MTISIPSRRVGDLQKGMEGGIRFPISIPSRRVGDLPEIPIGGECDANFHPLKAGRRPLLVVRLGAANCDFHPLKAGRRLVCQKPIGVEELISIPSRRVGDPAHSPAADKPRKVSIPSRRVGDPGGNAGKGGQKGAKERGGCRRPSVGGKS